MLPPEEQARVLHVTFLTLAMAGSSTLLACGAGIPLGAWLGLRKGRFGFAFRVFTHTFYGLPPVLAGLAVYLLLSRAGPLGPLGMLFTPEAMVVAQFVILFPLLSGLVASAVASVEPAVVDTCRALGASAGQLRWSIIREARFGILTAVMLGFGRAISEVGAVILVGGNIKWHTQVLTTAIVLETSAGSFEYALHLGGILLALAALTAFLLTFLQHDEESGLTAAFRRRFRERRRGG
jgi:tungstate transport system permease protein